MFDDTVIDVERKAIILALAETCQNIKIDIDMVGNQDKSNKYNILSVDGNLSINIDFEDTQSYSFWDLKNIIEYCFKSLDYECTPINDDYDALDNVTKLFNALVVKMGEEKNWTANNQPCNHLANSLYCSMTLAGDKFTCLIDTVQHEEEKLALILARHMVDNVVHELLFVDSSDLLDFLSATRLLADIVPMFF